MLRYNMFSNISDTMLAFDKSLQLLLGCVSPKFAPQLWRTACLAWRAREISININTRRSVRLFGDLGANQSSSVRKSTTRAIECPARWSQLHANGAWFGICQRCGSQLGRKPPRDNICQH